jgi:hypothetical protein
MNRLGPPLALAALLFFPACHPAESELEDSGTSASAEASTSPEPPDAEANPVTAEHTRLVVALHKLCEPKFAPLKRTAWSRDQVEINLFDKVELSKRDINEILALAAAQGLTEPVEISAGNRVHPGRNFQVWVEASIEEDAESQTRTQRTLCITCPEWEKERPYYPKSNAGGWKLARAFWAREDPWDERTKFHVRDGDHVWEFDMSRSLPRAKAIGLLQALGEGSYLVDDGVELEDGDLEFSEGWLGRITPMRDWRDSLTPRPDPSELEWDLQIGHSTGRWSGVELRFSNRDGHWILVGVSHWIA